MPSNPASLRSQMFATCGRIVLEKHLREHLPKLSGEVLVVGAGHNPYGALLPTASSVLTTDVEDIPGIDQVADCQDLPFDDGAFDAVVAIEVMEHVQHPWKAASEFHRVLRSGGRALVCTPFLYRVHGDPQDFQRFTADGLRTLLSKFSAVEVAGFGNRLHAISDIVTTTARWLGPLRLANHLIARGPVAAINSADCPVGFMAVATK